MQHLGQLILERSWAKRVQSVQGGQFRVQIQVGARFSAPFQTSLGAHPASCVSGYQVSFPAAGAWH